MKTYTLLITSLILVMSASLADQIQAQNQRGNSDFATDAIVLNESQPQETPRRGIFQPRESRLVTQLDDLTENQISRINELHEEHREQVVKLLDLRRSEQITREEFLTRRRANFDQHQEKLKEVLTKAQWDQLRKLRAERRNIPSDQ